MPSLAKKVAQLTVIATASRSGQAWVQQRRTHHRYGKPLRASESLGIRPGLVFSTTNTDLHFAELRTDRSGRLVIDDRRSSILRYSNAKRFDPLSHVHAGFKAILIEQGALLKKFPNLSMKVLQTTLAENFGAINAQNIKRAHTG